MDHSTRFLSRFPRPGDKEQKKKSKKAAGKKWIQELHFVHKIPVILRHRHLLGASSSASSEGCDGNGMTNVFLISISKVYKTTLFSIFASLKHTLILSRRVDVEDGWQRKRGHVVDDSSSHMLAIYHYQIIIINIIIYPLKSSSNFHLSLPSFYL